ncbi:unnamed protein product [Miscanthus lutarioriparius]|uniref:Aminotransferase class I/classII large domain-containing protein n=1 Tax=Miscanthus lutarioriparius TaxID=422564 RepID=A0A811P1J9_9POAL|nr:unnamed protein product [Miscanthus lutarioriparius]
MDKIEKIIREPTVSRYGSDDGLPELREALLEKLRRENKLTKSSVMVTAGANQIVTVVNPGNPSGAFIPRSMLEGISYLCKNAGPWLVVDNTYETEYFNFYDEVCGSFDNMGYNRRVQEELTAELRRCT